MATLFIARAYQYAFQTRPNVTLALTGGTFNALGDFVAQLSQILVSLLRITVLQDSLCRRRVKSTSHLVHMTMHVLLGSSFLALRSVCTLLATAKVLLTHSRIPGPVMGRWNTFLETRFPLKLCRHAKKISLGALGKRVAYDQLFMYVHISTLAGHSFKSRPQGPSRCKCHAIHIATFLIVLLQLCYFIGFMGTTEGRSPSQVMDKFRDIYGTALITNWKIWPLAQVRTICVSYNLLTSFFW